MLPDFTVHETSGQIMGSFSADHHFGSLTIRDTLGSTGLSEEEIKLVEA